MTIRSVLTSMRLAGLMFVIVIGVAPVFGQVAPLNEKTIGFLQTYKRVMHKMDHKEISREALVQYDKGVELLTAGDLNGGLDALEAAQVTDVMKDESRVLWAPYAQVIDDRALYPRALAFLQRLTLDHPKLAHLHTNLASTYGMYAGWLRDNDPKRMLGTSRLSLSEYEVALALAPDAFQAIYGHATYLSYVPGKEEVWEKGFRKLISMRPADLHGYPFSAVYQSFVDGLIRSGQDQKARMVLKEGLVLYPGSAALQALAKRLPEQK